MIYTFGEMFNGEFSKASCGNLQITELMNGYFLRVSNEYGVSQDKKIVIASYTSEANRVYLMS